MSKNRKILYISCMFLISLIVGVGFLLGNGTMIGEYENQDDIRHEVGIWTSDTKIEQTFIASRNNLSRLDFSVDSYHPWDSLYLDCRLFEIDTLDNPRDLTYEFIKKHLKEVRYKRINGWFISGHMFNSFSFAPIADAKDKRYLLSIQSPGLKKGGTSIFLASTRDRYDWGNLFVNGEKSDRDLGFRVLYLQPRIQLIQESFKKIALQKPFPFTLPAVYYVIFGGYLVGLGCFLYQISRR